jgi:hypothetical protein
LIFSVSPKFETREVSQTSALTKLISDSRRHLLIIITSSPADLLSKYNRPAERSVTVTAFNDGTKL